MPRGYAARREVGTIAPLALAGLVIDVVLLIGTLEFVRPNEPDGWELAGTVVPIAYIAWSIWPVAIGVLLLIGCDRLRCRPCRSGGTGRRSGLKLRGPQGRSSSNLGSGTKDGSLSSRTTSRSGGIAAYQMSGKDGRPT